MKKIIKILYNFIIILMNKYNYKKNIYKYRHRHKYILPLYSIHE